MVQNSVRTCNLRVDLDLPPALGTKHSYDIVPAGFEFLSPGGHIIQHLGITQSGKEQCGIRIGQRAKLLSDPPDMICRTDHITTDLTEHELFLNGGFGLAPVEVDHVIFVTELNTLLGYAVGLTLTALDTLIIEKRYCALLAGGIINNHYVVRRANLGAGPATYAFFLIILGLASIPL